MNTITAIESELEQHEEQQKVIKKSLHEQKLDLCTRLQLNRRLVEEKLFPHEQEQAFPRSATMRFLSRQSTRQIMHKAANAALGLQTFKTFRYGYKAVKFIKNFFKPEKSLF